MLLFILIMAVTVAGTNYSIFVFYPVISPFVCKLPIIPYLAAKLQIIPYLDVKLQIIPYLDVKFSEVHRTLRFNYTKTKTVFRPVGRRCLGCTCIPPWVKKVCSSERSERNGSLIRKWSLLMFLQYSCSSNASYPSIFVIPHKDTKYKLLKQHRSQYAERQTILNS